MERNIKLNQLKSGLDTAFVDYTHNSSLAYRPEFISNDYQNGKKVLSSLEYELLHCDAFSISVAFIKMSGIAPLLQVFKQLESRGIPGRILTTDYLTFSEPEAFDKLNSLKNISLKMYQTEGEKDGFHTKGYIFKDGKIYRIIVGSSNLTASAITVNQEWNTKIVSSENGAVAKDIISEFDRLWNSERACDYVDFIEDYRIRYKIKKEQQKLARESEVISIEKYKLEPNSMQVKFIESVMDLYESGENRALLISSTGTGKTYASAFALREMLQKRAKETGRNVRALFLVHREQIAKQALRSYKNVFGERYSFGLLSGNSKNYKSDILFSTMQMMAREDIMKKFNANDFDIIIIDEVHRAGADSYQRIMNYFTPRFWIGMTASPDRTDGYDIYGLFNHNIAYEIRLQQAMEEKLLCPFHYFGITDLEVDGHVIDDDDLKNVQNFAKLVCDDRVQYIMQQIEYYGYSGDRVKGLMFCSSKEEAKTLSVKFNMRGLRTIVLTGDSSQNEREDAILRLEQNEQENALDYILTVDIFNEGVDVPAVNQVIMLRPTESPIVFIQQLGRGLRKYAGKEYVVILDFIGNYMNNFMIPIALSGDRTYNKDTIRKYVREGSRVIPGESTIHFDEISKKRIFESIDSSKTTKSFLKEKYFALKYKLGRVPNILDFYEYGEIDPMLFIQYSRSYDQFVKTVDKDFNIMFGDREEAILEFISSLVNGKRVHELLMFKCILNNEKMSPDAYRELLEEKGEIYREADYVSALNVLGKVFVNAPSEKKRYSNIEFISMDYAKNGILRRASAFYSLFSNNAFVNEVESLVKYGLKRYEDLFKNHDEDNLVLYEKYSRKDVCRILNWEHDDSSTVYGYRIKHNTCPIFVTYEKKDDIANSTKYEDQFINNQLFSWMTRSKVSLESPESQKIINYSKIGLKIYLFIKKSDGEGTDFYYMGKVSPIDYMQTEIENDNGQRLPIMNFKMKLEHSVREDIYEYFVG
ncbi:putative uncharacterized protein [Clostridium sp. CAG:253]|nr:putative uncharacterized protein [Clostridium sp. CAG:253]